MVLTHGCSSGLILIVGFLVVVAAMSAVMTRIIRANSES